MQYLLSLLRAVADRNRLRIIAALQQHSELCACQITELLQVKGATASRHLSILTASGLINSRKQGRWVFFRLEIQVDEHAQLLSWVKEQLQLSPDLRQDSARLGDIMALDPVELCRRQRGESCC